MLSFVVLMAGQSPAPLGISEDQAVSAGTRILTAFGVDGPYVKNLVQTTNYYGPKAYVVGITAGDGTKCGAYVQQGSGRCWMVLCGKQQSGMLPPRPVDARSVEQQVATAEVGLRQLFGRGSVLPGHFRESGDEDCVSVPIAVQGFPFVQDGTAETYDRGWVTVRLDARTGALKSFYDEVPQVPLEFVKPRLDEAGAVRIAERLLKVEKPKRPTEWYIGRSVQIDRPAAQRWNSAYDAERKLGWYVPKEAKAGRLAWRIPYEWRWRTGQKTGTQYLGGFGVILIDASTGGLLGQTSDPI